MIIGMNESAALQFHLWTQLFFLKEGNKLFSPHLNYILLLSQIYFPLLQTLSWFRLIFLEPFLSLIILAKFLLFKHGELIVRPRVKART